MATDVVIIGDFIKSKQIKERKVFQKQVQAIFKRLNQKYQKQLLSQLTLTVGDEFQVIMKLDSNWLNFLDDLYVTLPHPFRLGIGIGEITTAIDPERSIGADGPAFWRAREAIEAVHRNHYGNKCHLALRTQDDSINQMVNSLFLLSETLKSQWTDLQRETFKLMLEEGIYQAEFDQAHFAQTIQISQSSLSKRLSLGNIKIYLRGRETIAEFLEGNHESL
ncbi:SatD family protein [Facklamia sp. P9177]|uniref:SatD family protein n=1 Tax=Facklamia sp. P9177 TaxID=3421945 RepID=UPI003D16559B